MSNLEVTSAKKAPGKQEAESNVSAGVCHDVVLGCPRSGTTFLMSALSTLPELECMNGTLLPVAIPHVVATQDFSDKVYDAFCVGFERALHTYLRSGQYHSRTAALQKWLRAPTTGLRGLWRALRGLRSVPERMIYKENFLTFTPDFVLDALPDARVVHLYRDGRDVANSLVESYDVLTDEDLTHLRSSEMRIGRAYDHRYVPWWVEDGCEEEFLGSPPYVRAIWMWKHMVRRCHDFFSQPKVQESGQVMLLRYEDFVRDPEMHGRAVLDHLGLTPNRMSARRLRQARTSSIGKYERRDAKEIEEAERVANDELELYGYI